MKTIIPAHLGTFLVFKQEATLFVGGHVIAWSIDADGYATPINALNNHNGDNLFGVHMPDGSVETQESNWPTLEAAKAEVAKNPNTL